MSDIDWIDTEDEKPEYEINVIVCLRNKTVTTGYYFKNDDAWKVDGEYTNEVIFWQPLPLPPSGMDLKQASRFKFKAK